MHRSRLLLLFFPLLLLLLAPVPAFAASSSTHPAGLDSQQCLITTLQGVADGPQTFTVILHVTNSCGTTFPVSLRVNTQKTDCPPFEETSITQSVVLRDQQTAAASPGYTAGCVGCTNLVPTEFPQFTIRVTVLAFGSFSIGDGTTLQATSHPSMTEVTLTNNPPLYVPPCP